RFPSRSWFADQPPATACGQPRGRPTCSRNAWSMLAEPPWSDDLATLDALVTHGLQRRTVRNRIARGLWLEPLPAVVCRTHGELRDAQILHSDALYPRAR